MKKIHTLLFALGIFTFSNAQNIDFVDLVFKEILIQEGIDTNSDGEISLSEAASIDSLHLARPSENLKITDLSDIEFFENLVYLNCSYHELVTLRIIGLNKLQTINCHNSDVEELDLNLPLLDTLICSSNDFINLDKLTTPLLRYLDCFSYNGNMANIDLQGLSNLETLILNNHNVTELDLEAVPLLTNLDCTRNRITNLDLSHTPNLVELDCQGNSLTSLNLEFTPELVKLNFSSNDITELNLENAPNLEILRCTSNALEILNLEHVPLLKELYCSRNNLTSLSFENVPNLEILYSQQMDISGIDFSPLQKLITLSVDDHTSEHFILEGLLSLSNLYCGSQTMNSIELNNFPRLKNLGIDKSSLTTLNLQGLDSLQNLNVRENSLTSINLSNMESLESLRLEDNQLGSIDLSNLPNLKILDCNNNQLSNLDLSNLINLETLYCGANNLVNLNLDNLNNLVNLNLDNLINLETLSFSGNDIQIIFFSNLPKLSSISCINSSLISASLINLTSLNYLSLYNNDLSNLTIENSPSLSRLNIYNNALEEISLNGLDGLNYADLSDNELTEIDFEDLSILEELWLDGNKITELNLSNLPSLTTLDVYSNELVSLTLIDFPSLSTLRCGNNQIANLDLQNLPNLTGLSCNNNEISDLSSIYLPKLYSLVCYANRISSLDLSQFPELRILLCANNQISTINFEEAPRLGRVEIDNNQLAELNISNHAQLRTIDCRWNQIQEVNLINLPSLVEFISGANPYSSLYLENLPVLDRIHCTHTGLVELDISHLNSLTLLECNGNDLMKHLNLKNGLSLEGASYSGLESLEYICVNEWEVERYQSIIDNYGYSSFATSYCSFVPGGEVSTVEGNINFMSEGLQCDVDVYPQKILVSNGTEDFIFSSSLDSNAYKFYLSPGIYTVAVVKNPDYFEVVPDILHIDIQNDPSSIFQDFCINAVAESQDLQISIIPINETRPGFESKYKIIYSNLGSTTMDGEVRLIFPSEFVSIIESVPPEDNITDESIVWNYVDLEAFESREIIVELEIATPMSDPPVDSGTVLNFKASILPFQNDLNTRDNVACLADVVVNAFDPNDKTCLQGESLTEEMIGEYVDYRIRFENVGSAAAVHVVVKDSIDLTKFDIRTLEIVDNSHDMVYKIHSDNIVEFIFENIWLPFEDESNDGYVVFKIKTLANLQLGDVITNKAEIFFDFNFPVVTNTATTTFETNTSTDDGSKIVELSISPNPASSQIIIESNEIIESVEICNTQGKRLKNVDLDENKNKIDISELSPGIYIITITTKKSSSYSSKFLKI